VNTHTPPTPLRASHINTGTSVPQTELPWPKTGGPVMRMPKLHTEVDDHSPVTSYGGLILFSEFVRRFKVAEKIDDNVEVLKLHLPYLESDHILAQAANLYVGGTCIEDMANLQNSEAVRRLFGACRLPDPTTAGDFLRRFDDRYNPGSLDGLRRAVDEVQDAVWKRLAKKEGSRKRECAVLDIDGHTKKLYGAQKEGADFSREGTWSYHPLLISMAGTGECLAVMNRPGNLRSSNGAAEVLDGTLERVGQRFQSILVRADSDYERKDILQTCQRHGAYFALVGRAFRNRPGIAESIPEQEWIPFTTRAERQKEERRKKGATSRRRRGNLRRERARERGYKDLYLAGQWVAEVPWTPKGLEEPCRLIIRRQLIEHRRGQQFLFTDYRYRYVLTNLPPSWSAQAVIDATYERCDQENVIEQMGSGLAAWRMPVGEFAGNSAWLEIARLAWNIARWVAQLALPAEVIRWKWKRFRQAFVYLTAHVIKGGRQIWVRLSDSHRFTDTLIAAHQRIQI